MIQAAKDRGMKLEFGEDAGVFMARFVGAAQVVSRPADVQISARQEKALQYLATQGKITTLEYQRLCGVGERQSLKDLRDMTEKGMLVRSGRGRATHYRLPMARLRRDHGASECGISAGFGGGLASQPSWQSCPSRKKISLKTSWSSSRRLRCSVS